MNNSMHVPCPGIVRKASVFALLCLFLLCGCSSGSTHVKTVPPQAYDTLIIRNVELENAKLEDDRSSNLAEYRAAQDRVVKAYGTALEEYVKSRDLFRTVVVSDSADEAQKYENPLVLQTRFDRIVLGNRVMRIARYFTAGVPLIGRGIMEIEASGRLVDGRTGKVIDVQHNDTNTSWDPRGLEDNLLKMTRNMAGQYGEFVENWKRSGEVSGSYRDSEWE